MKSTTPDEALTLYQWHCRYVRLAGMSIEHAAEMWRDMKGRYSTDEQHRSALLEALQHTTTIEAEEELRAWSTRTAIEGDEFSAEVRRRTREPLVVRSRLEEDQYICQRCGFSAPRVVNDEGDVVTLDAMAVDVHHIEPLSDGQRTTRLEDLVTLCPTCHRLLHAVGKTIGRSQLKVDLLDRCVVGRPDDVAG